MKDVFLYGILDTGYVPAAEISAMCLRMLDGGVQAIQLRAKHESRDEILAMAPGVRAACLGAGVPFILNDYPDLAAEVGADAVHVGQDDLSVAEARRLAGDGLLVGKSTHSLDQAVQAQDEGADYIGFGPLFATPTKPDYCPIGMADIGAVHEAVTIPVFCIGGIKVENLSSVLQAGAKRVVVVSGILQAADPAQYARECREILLGGNL